MMMSVRALYGLNEKNRNLSLLYKTWRIFLYTCLLVYYIELNK